MSGRSRSSARLALASASLLLVVAGAVRLEMLLIGWAADAGPTWRGAVLVLLALLFVPALLLGAALAVRLRRRGGGG